MLACFVAVYTLPVQRQSRLSLKTVSGQSTLAVPNSMLDPGLEAACVQEVSHMSVYKIMPDLEATTLGLIDSVAILTAGLLGEG